ncbi:DUF1206 domain-containing protein [Amnibacterium endophyticum]|uniref:DUF1206 domain-containing protein n=1 Tax=Amnibacterium endophyticum TaxID=2109337 RepID=A0ABW4LHA1_9MICO
MARAGYGGSAVLRLLIGVLALLLALRAPGAQPDVSGAFGAVARVPGGVVLLGLVAIGEAALAVWLVVAGILSSSSHTLERWRQRLVYWGRAVFYGVVATTAARFALGAHENSARSEHRAERHLLDAPGGPVVLALLGATVLVVGVGMVWVGGSLRFRRTIHVPASRGRRRCVLVVGAVGYVVRGITLAVVGVLVAGGAFTDDPHRSDGLAGALDWLAADPVGRIVLALLGAGWIVSAVYSALRIRIARLG